MSDNNVTSIQTGKYKCKSCGKEFIVRGQYTEYADDEIALSCPWCNKVFVTYSTRRHNQYTVHRE